MIIDKILDAFPPPKFLDIPFAGLSISDDAIRCIQFGRTHSKLYIQKYSEKKLPFGVVTSGQVNNKEELTKILQDLKKELDLSYVKISLPEEKAYLFTAKIPIVKREGIKSAVESKIEENVPVPPGELIFDYKVMNHNRKDYLDVVVSTLPINVADTYIDIATAAGLHPLSLEVESQAIVRALLPHDKKDTVLVVNFSEEKVGLYVASERVVHFTSTIVMKKDGQDNEDFLSQEVKRLYTYWHALKENVDKPEKNISQIIVCGENFSDSILTYLSTHNKTKTVTGNVWVNVFDINKTVPEISFKDSLKYAAAIGLALHTKTLI